MDISEWKLSLSRQTCLQATYLSTDPMAFAVDAFTIARLVQKIYASLSWNLIGKVLSYAAPELILVAPVWKACAQSCYRVPLLIPY